MESWLYGVNQWLVWIASVVAISAAAEGGYRLGHRGRWQGTGGDSQISALQNASLGLLALMIGFTFAMALSRFEARKQLLLDEANAIGTADLRARFLPDRGTEVHAMLRDYVDVRLDFHAAVIDTPEFQQAIAKTKALQQRLWEAAVAGTAADPRSVAVGSFVSQLNDLIDLHEKNLTARRNHVPEVVILLLYGIAAVSLGFTGYACGLDGKAHRIPNAVMALVISTVILMLTDLDRPQRGLITVSPQPLLDTRADFGS